jgi:type IV pilus assembly protein PilA
MLRITTMVEPPHTKAVGRASSRGYTLTEMVVVVAMIGTLAAMAIVGYRKYINAAQAAEAKTMILAIRGGQETYKSEMLQYLPVSGAINDYYPNTNPNDTKYSWVYPPHVDYPNWMLLNINPDGPVRFGYACVAGVGGNITLPNDFTTPPTVVGGGAVANNTPWYSIQAKNQRSATRPPEVYASLSIDNSIVSQNGDE